MTCFVFAKTLWGPGGHSGRPWSQLSGVCVLLHAWAGLGGFPGASCRGICVLLHAWAGLGDSLEPAVAYMCVAACLGGPRGSLWSQLSGICVLLHAWAGLRRVSEASRRLYVCCCMLERASGDTLEPAVGYMCVAACLGGPRRRP